MSSEKKMQRAEMEWLHYQNMSPKKKEQQAGYKRLNYLNMSPEKKKTTSSAEQAELFKYVT